jgi:hypothetical protein
VQRSATQCSAASCSIATAATADTAAAIADFIFAIAATVIAIAIAADVVDVTFDVVDNSFVRSLAHPNRSTLFVFTSSLRVPCDAGQDLSGSLEGAARVGGPVVDQQHVAALPLKRHLYLLHD